MAVAPIGRDRDGIARGDIAFPLADARVRRDHRVTNLSHGRRRRMSYGDTEPSEFHGGEARALRLSPPQAE